ncbi:MAG: prolyl hydroxylase family protein [Gammaproteobacteria bacterium]
MSDALVTTAGIERLLAEGRVARAARVHRGLDPDDPAFVPAGAVLARAGAMLTVTEAAQNRVLSLRCDEPRELAALFSAIEPLGAGDAWASALRAALRRIAADEARGWTWLAVVLEHAGAAAAQAVLGEAAQRGDPVAAALGAGERTPIPTLRDLIGQALAGLARAEPRLERAEVPVGTRDDAAGPIACGYLREAAREHGLNAALVLDPVTGERRPHPHRTSFSAQLPRGADDPVAEALLFQLSGLAGLPVSHIEPLAILHYLPGQEYRPHGDWLPAATQADASHLQRFGQRTHTVLLYLNTPEHGGALTFPELGITIAAQLGRAVCFENTDADEQPRHDSLHASLPVETGEKWVASLWFRSKAIVR